MALTFTHSSRLGIANGHTFFSPWGALPIPVWHYLPCRPPQTPELWPPEDGRRALGLTVQVRVYTGLTKGWPGVTLHKHVTTRASLPVYEWGPPGADLVGLP